MRDSTRAVVLFGRSGLGKTSLLQAGLFPRLRRQGVLPVSIRLAYAAERGLVAQVREALLTAAAGARVEALPLPPEETLWESFHRAGANFWSESNRIVVPLLVFDQFEEIFTLGRTDPAGRDAFLAELADLVEGRPPDAVRTRLDAEPALALDFTPERHDYKILLSLRQDFLADLDSLRARMRSLGSSRLALLHMDGEAALRVVLQAGGPLIEPEVAARVVRFVAGAGRRSAAASPPEGAGEAPAAAPGEPPAAAAASPAAAPPGPHGDAGAAQPPLAELEVDPTLLSLICRELNNRRRERGEPTITFDLLSGSWREILSRFYENALAGMPPAVRTFVEDRLLTRSGYRDSVAWDNAVAEPGVTAADLLALRDRRLLRFEERHGATWIELTHDVVTEVIGESREMRRQREALLHAEEARVQAEAALRDAAERERLAQERELQTRNLLARSRRLARVLAVVLLAAIGLGCLGGWLWRRSEIAERRAERALLDSAGNLIEKDRGAQALAYLAAIMRLSPQRSGAARSRALDILLHESWALPIRVVRHERAVLAAQLSPDGERLLTASAGGTARLWRVRDGAALATMSHREDVELSVAAFSPDATRVLTAATDGTLRLWDGATGAPVGREMKADPELAGAVWSPRGDRILTSTAARVRLWNAGTQQLVALGGAPGAAAVATDVAAFSQDGRRLLVGGPGDSMLWFDLAGGAVDGVLRLPGREVSSQIVFDHRGDRLLAVGATGTLRIWDLATRRLISEHEHPAVVVAAAWSPDDRSLLIAGDDKVVRLWSLDAPGAPAKLLQHDRRVVDAQFSPDGRWVLTGSRDGTARLWDVRTGEPEVQPLRHAAPLEAIGWSSDGRLAVTASDDGSAKVWELRPGHYARPVQLQPAAADAAIDARGLRVVAVLRDGTARLWHLATDGSSALAPAAGRVVRAATLADGRIAVIAVGAVGAVAGVGGVDAAGQHVQVWDGRTGRPLGPPIPMGPAPRADPPDLTPDGDRLLWAGAGGIDIWDTATGRLIATLPAAFRHPRLSPDGRRVVALSAAGAGLWNTATGAQVGEVARNDARLAGFDPLGRLFVVTSGDDRLRLFDRMDARPRTLALAPEGNVVGVDWSRDGSRLAITTLGGDARILEVRTGRALCVLHLPLDVRGQPFITTISADGTRFLTRSADGYAQVWDVESCRELTEPLWQPPPSRVAEARFSGEGAHVLTLDDQGIARVWDLPETSADDSEPLADLAEAVGGFAVDSTGNSLPLRDQVQRLAQLRAAAARPGQVRSLALGVERWFFAAPDHLTLSPFSTIPAPGAAMAGQRPAS